MMRRSTLGLLFLLPLLHSSSATPTDFTYTAVSSLQISPNSTHIITTTLHSANTFPVSFTFSLQDYRNETVGSETTYSFTQLGTKEVELKVGDLSQEKYYLIVVGNSPKASVDEKVIVSRAKKSRVLLIQTDKPIYKPGEKVQFRVFLLSKYFQPEVLNQKVRVKVYDPQRNVILLLEDETIKGGKGFLSSDFQLSPEPILGSWSVEVEDKEGKAERASFPFTVEEYVLPKYKVEVSTDPTFTTYNDSAVRVLVTAAYSYGKPVEAECTITLKEPNSYYFREGRIPSSSKTLTLTNGKADVEFDIRKELNLNRDEVNKWGKSFTIFTSCKDAASGNVRNSSNPITMYQFPYKIDLVEKPDKIIPGFPVNLTIKVSRQDGFPISDPDPEAIQIEHGFEYTAELATVKRPIPSNGLVELSFTASTNPKVCYEALDVTYKELKESLWLPSKTVSRTGSYILVHLTNESSTTKLREGEDFTVSVLSSKSISYINALILSRGDVKLSKQIPVPAEKEFELTLRLPYGTAPKADLVLYTIYQDEDLIADAVHLDVRPRAGAEVVVSVTPEEVEPGKNVSIHVKGHELSPTSTIGIRAVDQSVLLLKKDNDLTEERLGNAASGFRPRGIYWSGSDVFQTFGDNGLVLLTNGRVTKGYTSENIYPLGLEPVSMNKLHYVQNSPEYGNTSTKKHRPLPASAPQSTTFRPGQAFSGGSVGSSPPPKTRTFFPETWIWEDFQTSNGELTLHRPVPDTITSWFISAFQLDSTYGLALSTTPPKLTVFRPFFISLNLPYSMVKGEVLGLQVLVANYLDKPVNATVTVENEDKFFAFVEQEVGAVGDPLSKTVSLSPSSILPVVFPIIPQKFGTMRLKVVAVSAEAGDAVERSLLVRPPGIKHTQNTAQLIYLPSTGSNVFEKQGLAASFPAGRVEDADSLKVTVIGDILGGTFNNLDALISLPHGCGEQNMVAFVPDIVILDYLNKTGTLSSEVRGKALAYLSRGYQQQLKYLRYDGSYSAFGKSDSVGSTWLTAFVTRAFIQARRYITIDEEVIAKSLRFLQRMQNDNGSFTEEGFVYDRSLVGGGATKDLSLAAFTLLTFAEADAAGLNHTYEINRNNATVLERGVEYILNQSDEIKKSNDAHSVNLISYLLHLIQHPRRDEFFEVSEGLARVDEVNGTIHWEQITKQKPAMNVTALLSKWRGLPPYYPTIPATKPATVEITSYGLLTYLLRGPGRLTSSVKIAKWLLRHRNAAGGFYSTQDTVQGFTALGKFGEMLQAGDSQVNVHLTYNGGDASFNVNAANRIVAQEYYLPRSVQSIALEANGTGSALVQLSWSYYIENIEAEPAFSVTASLAAADNGRTLTLSVCGTYVRGSRSNMAILKGSAPSGYAFDQEDLEALRREGSFKRYELEDKDSHLALYFEYLSSTKPTCVDVKAYRVYLVAKHAPASLKLYDYYDNTQKTEVLYEVHPIGLCHIICKVGAKL